MENTDLELSLIAGNIVTNALQLTRNLFCPYCAEAFMFEFTLKDHLKKSHPDLILKHILKQNPDELDLSLSSDPNKPLHNCAFCGAAFVHFGLIPKHISTYHGSELFKLWERHDGNRAQLEQAKENEPSIVYAAGSPGLSDVFDRMSTLDGHQSDGGGGGGEATTPHQLKSILKKTPTKMRIICSPSSAAIRRTKSDAVRRTLSVRRELRFDPTVKNSKSPTKDSPDIVPAIGGTAAKKSHFFKLSNPFQRKQLKPTQSAVPNKIITSTPIHFLDDDRCAEEQETNRKQWKATIRRNRPLFLSSERFQCAICKKSWESNAELLFHLSDHHRGVRRWLRPQYQCSQCGATFFNNSYLVKHCHKNHSVGGGGAGARGRNNFVM